MKEKSNGYKGDLTWGQLVVRELNQMRSKLTHFVLKRKREDRTAFLKVLVEQHKFDRIRKNLRDMVHQMLTEDILCSSTKLHYHGMACKNCVTEKPFLHSSYLNFKTFMNRVVKSPSEIRKKWNHK